MASTRRAAGLPVHPQEADPVNPRIHPSAVVSPDAELPPDVSVGALAIIEGHVRLGPGCVVRPRAHLIGPLVMGRDNQIYGNATIGERPQHTRYRDEPTGVRVGDGNVFRENVTVHRGTTESWETRIGDGNYFMAGSHVAHDCRVGDRCTLVNNALLGGHCVLSDGAYVSGNAGVHQHCRLGRLALLSGGAITTKDVPPFVIQQGVNTVCGVNVIGMRRAGLAAWQIDAVRRTFHVVFRQGLILPDALLQVEEDYGEVDVVREFVAFVRASQRGINRIRGVEPGRAAADSAGGSSGRWTTS
jgi:UDP-N-acetylglucosamine acyltransferase